MSLTLECFGGPKDGDTEMVSGRHDAALEVYREGDHFILSPDAGTPLLGIYYTDFTHMQLTWEPVVDEGGDEGEG